MTGNNTVRVGISGLGSFSIVIANTIQRSKKVELVTCFDVDPERRKAIRERYGCAEEKSFEDMVKRVDLDGVLLITPNAIHREQTELAASYGKHVFVEKPIANTLEDGRRMIEACRKAGLKLLVGHVQRRHAANRKVKQLIEDGAIGKVIMVEANLSSGQGWDLTRSEFRWRGDDSGCPGGALMTIGSHQADTLNYIFGPIKNVFAFFNKLYIPAPVEDVTTTIFQCESGVLGYLGCNFASPRTNWMRVYGTEANLLRTVTRVDRRFDAERKQGPDQSTRLELFEKGSTEPKEIPLTIGDPLLEEIEEFADCILTGRKPETDGPSSLKALALIRAAIESARTGKPCDIEI
ncbi:MAG: Gfo/Idh/MocA family oxidoreductase [Gammaproteobacteria bacterium]|nr:Gfo/Idh/MocA family oxidoreductase [Gammaproteobacteria bacterium]